VGAQSLEDDLRSDDPSDRSPIRRNDAKAADDAMASTGQQPETALGARPRIGLREDATAAGYDGVGGQDVGLRITGRDGSRLG
jgi:hypothetical protein